MNERTKKTMLVSLELKTAVPLSATRGATGRRRAHDVVDQHVYSWFLSQLFIELTALNYTKA